MLDLEPIRARLKLLNRWEGWLITEDADADANKQDERAFVQNAPDDIAALIEEVERLRLQLEETEDELCEVKERLDDLDIDL